MQINILIIMTCRGTDDQSLFLRQSARICMYINVSSLEAMPISVAQTLLRTYISAPMMGPVTRISSVCPFE